MGKIRAFVMRDPDKKKREENQTKSKNYYHVEFLVQIIILPTKGLSLGLSFMF